MPSNAEPSPAKEPEYDIAVADNDDVNASNAAMSVAKEALRLAVASPT